MKKITFTDDLASRAKKENFHKDSIVTFVLLWQVSSSGK